MTPTDDAARDHLAPATTDAGPLARLAVAALLVLVPLVPWRYLPDHAVPGWADTALRHLGLGLCLVAVGACVWPYRRQWRSWLGSLPLGLPLLGLLAVGLVSGLGAHDAVASVARGLYGFASGAAVYLALAGAAGGRRWLRPIIALCLATGAAVAAVGVAEYLAGRPLVYAAWFDPANPTYRQLAPDPWFERRIVTTIGHPVVVGAYLATLLPLALSSLWWAPGRRWRALAAGAALAVGTGLALTFSRGAWVASAAGLAVLAWCLGRRRLLMLVVGVALLGAIVAAMTGAGSLARTRVQAAYRDYGQGFSATTRGAAYGYVATIATESPWLGLGPGMYRYAAYDLRRTLGLPTPLGVLDTPDSMYLSWLAETGVVGLTASVYVLLALARALRRRLRQAGDPADHALVAGLLASLVSLAVDMLTVDALHFPVVRLLFWVLAAAMATVSGLGGNGPGRDRPGPQ
jgi:hypothetical protein